MRSALPCRMLICLSVLGQTALADTQPAGIWHLDEGEGIDAWDCSRSSNHGRLGLASAAEGEDDTDPAAYPAWIEGLSGAALRFDGNDFVRTRSNSAPLQPQRITVEAWVRGLPAPTGSRYIVAKPIEHTSVVSYGLFTGADRSIHFYLGVDAAPGVLGLEAITQPGVPLEEIWNGEWHHVAGTYDGEEAVLYVDGARRSAAPAALPVCYADGTDSRDCATDGLGPLNTLYIGDRYDRRPGGVRDTRRAFIGDIDEVRLWPRALSTAEIAERIREDRSCGTILGLGEARESTLTPEQPAACFKLRAPVATAVVLTLTDLDPEPSETSALYVRWCEPPDPLHFDLAQETRHQSTQRLVIPSTRNETCHVLVLGSIFGGASSRVRIEARRVELALESISVRTTAVGSRVNAVVRGAGFDDSILFALGREDESGCVDGIPCVAAGKCCGFQAVGTTVTSSTRAELVFDLAAALPGPYGLVAESSGAQSAGFLPSALTVVESSVGGLLATELRTARAYRKKEWARLRLRYRNIGDAEMLAPLLKVSGPDDVEFRLESPAGDPEVDREILVLGVHAGGVPGTLPAGGEVELPIYFRRQSDAEDEFTLRLQVLKAAAADTLDWADFMPPEVPPESREAVRAGLAAALGTSWEELHQSIAALATRLARRGAYPASVRQLFRFAVRQAYGRPTAALVGRAAETGTGIPRGGVDVVALEAVAGGPGGGGVEQAVKSSARTSPDGTFVLDWLEPGHTYTIGAVGHDVTSGLPNPVSIPLDGDVLDYAIRVATDPSPGLVAACPNCDEGGLPGGPPAVPAALFADAAAAQLRVIKSFDPNDKEGAGEQGDIDLGYIGEGTEITYTVHFENVRAPGQTEDPAAARRVVVEDDLDPALDPSSLVFRDVVLTGSGPVALDSCESAIERICTGRGESYTSSQSAAVEATFTFGGESKTYEMPVLVTASVVRAGEDDSYRLVWELNLDQASANDVLLMDLEDNPEIGFLPATAGGTITFNVMPMMDVMEGREVTNSARITFDQNEPLGTNTVRSIFSHFPRPQRPYDPGPEDGAVGLPTSVSFEWEGDGATSWALSYWWEDGETVRDLVQVTGLSARMHTAAGLASGRTYLWKVEAQNDNGSTIGEPWTFTTAGGDVAFRRGDVNADGNINITDPIAGLNFLFLGGPSPPCQKALDGNDDGGLNITDPIFILGFLFTGGARPPPPNECGFDPTGDPVACATFRPCE